jgi:hypothetical protein
MSAFADRSRCGRVGCLGGGFRGRAWPVPRERLKPCSQSASARDRAYRSPSGGFTRSGRNPADDGPRFRASVPANDALCGSDRVIVPSVPANGFAAAGTRWRPSPTARAGSGRPASSDRFGGARGRLTGAVEALFAERVSARQGLSQSQRRVYPLRTKPGRRRSPLPGLRSWRMNSRQRKRDVGLRRRVEARASGVPRRRVSRRAWPGCASG